MDKLPPLSGDDKQRSHQEFLNAIRNKFGLQQDTNAPKSDGKASLPILRPANGYKLPPKESTTFNYFTAQLVEQTSNKFDIPLLRNGYKKTVEPALPHKESQASYRSNLNCENYGTSDLDFDIPLLRKKRILNSAEPPEKCELVNLREDVNRLKITEDFKEPISEIDLTIALNLKGDAPSTSSRMLAVRPDPVEHFEIPFIECDLPLKSANIIQINLASKEQTPHIAVGVPKAKPSPFGRVVTLHYKSKSGLPRISHRFERKHKISAFRFDKHSPDDIVTAALNKIPRRV